MTCEKAMDRYLALDKNEWVPFRVTLHLFLCPICRTSVRRMTQAEKLLKIPLSVTKRNNTTETIAPAVAAALSRIRSNGFVYMPEEDEHQVSLSRWLFAGIVLAGSFAFFPFSSMGIWTRTVFGSSFYLPYYLVCGIAVTVYCGFFVGTNIDFFIKKFGIDHSI